MGGSQGVFLTLSQGPCGGLAGQSGKTLAARRTEGELGSWGVERLAGTTQAGWALGLAARLHGPRVWRPGAGPAPGSEEGGGQREVGDRAPPQASFRFLWGA